MDWRRLILAACAASFMRLGAQTNAGPISRSTESSVFFSGSVQMEDGSAPVNTVIIQQICQGLAKEVARTDSKGRFNFSVGGSSPTLIGDAADTQRAVDIATPIGSSTRYTNPVSSSLRGCQLMASLAGFSSERVDMSIHNTLDNTNVGTLVLHPTSRAGSLSVSSTTLSATPAAKRDYQKGEAALNAHKMDAAAREFEKAVKDDPHFAAAWFELGSLRQDQKDLPGAEAAWKQSLQCDAKYLKPYQALAGAAYTKGDWSALDQYAHSWIQLDPEDFPEAYLFNAFASAKLGHLSDAERLAQSGVQADKQKRFPKLQYVLAVVSMQEGKYAESAKAFRDYLALAPDSPDAPAIREQVSRLEIAAAPKPDN